jgi:hypothetical protein
MVVHTGQAEKVASLFAALNNGGESAGVHIASAPWPPSLCTSASLCPAAPEAESAAGQEEKKPKKKKKAADDSLFAALVEGAAATPQEDAPATGVRTRLRQFCPEPSCCSGTCIPDQSSFQAEATPAAGCNPCVCAPYAPEAGEKQAGR